MTTLDDYAAVLAERAEQEIPPEERVAFVYDALQHQGTPKRAAYEQMPELVALEMEQDVWELWGIIGAGAGRAGALDRASSEARERLPAALYEASRRIFERLRAAENEGETVSLLAALAGVLRQTRMHDVLTRLDAGIEHRCERCGAHVDLRRQGPNLVRNGAPVPPEEQVVGPPALVVEAASFSRYTALASVLTALFGPHQCPRCEHPQRLLDSAATSIPLKKPADPPVWRRPDASGEATLEIPAPVRDRLVARLVAIATTKSADMVRLAGVGELGVQRALGWPSSNATIPAPGERVPLAMIRFRVAGELGDLVHDRPVSQPTPSDDPALDELATRVLQALTQADAVQLPGIGRFELRENEARRGATVDGDPTIVPRRRLVAFVAAPELKKELNSAIRAS